MFERASATRLGLIDNDFRSRDAPDTSIVDAGLMLQHWPIWEASPPKKAEASGGKQTGDASAPNLIDGAVLQ